MENFSRAIARTATAQIAYAAGFDGIQESANEALAEIMLKFMAEIGACAHAHCEVAGRTTPNIVDVLVAFEDLGVSLQDLMDYAKPETDIPFEHSLSSYPVKVPSRWKPTFQQLKETPPAHIPSFYPALPDVHTYKDTPLYVGHDRDKLRQREKLDKIRRSGEQTLLSLADRTAAATAAAAVGGAAGAEISAAARAPSPEKARRVEEKRGPRRNPFLVKAALEDRKARAGGKGEVPMDVEPKEVCKPLAEEGGSLDVVPAVLPAGNGGKPPPGPGEKPTLDAAQKGTSVGWREASPAGSGEMQAKPTAGIALDWFNRGRVRNRASITDLGLDDAFTQTGEEEDTGHHRKHKHKSKHRRRAEEEDPAVARADLLLAAGSEAMALEEEAPPPGFQ